jgi:NlpC/P60 family
MAVSGSDIVKFAEQFIGTPYVWGGNSLSSGVDCSGLVQQVYKHFGLTVPRVTYDQITQGKAISMNNLQPGDMVFFDTNPSVSGPDHVGIYIGNGKFIEAPKPGKGVQISDLKSGYYENTFMGGRRISGIVGGGPNDDQNDPTAPAVTRLSPEELASEYGFAYSFLNSIPEIKRLFSQYVSEDWSQDKFTAELKQTNWWQKNSDTMRKTQAQKATDPATYNANLQATTVQIQQLAAEIGASIPPGKLKSIAEKALATNMDEGQLRNVLGGYVTFVKGTLVGDAGVYQNSIKSYAMSQGITLDDQTVKNQAALIERKMATESDFKDQIRDQAISSYPAYKDQLMGGTTLSDIASPYVQIMAQELDMNPASIKLTDPLIRNALAGVNSQGKPTGLDQTDFMQTLRNDPRWASTKGAQDSVMNVGLNVLKSMGLR